MIDHFGYKNKMEVPIVTHISINMGIGDGKDNPKKLEYPTPVEHANDTEEVFVGRIRVEELAKQNWVSLWVVADNVYGKGAALNAVQIAERLLATNKF